MEKFKIEHIKTIIGLGNPGRQYYKNRHNIGFRIIDELAQIFSAKWINLKDMNFVKINIDLGVNIHEIFLIKPNTFMNNSGDIVPFLNKKGIKIEEVLVIHDELQKKFGDMSIKFGGSARGHNGLRSIIEKAGSDFWRLRFGIGRPEQKSEVGNYVLSNFSKEEEDQLVSLIPKAINLILNKSI
ncbi:aminoacyl-tRNA hydrolase [Candidatus Dependentiae bacterium]|nr:aminoacyl-tRNA hydrolase [Candidatus Dependentiae bacterium]